MIVLLLLPSIMFSQQTETINGVKFKVTIQRLFLKEEKLFAVYRSYLDSKGNFQFGHILEAKRNDSLFIKGKLKLDKSGKIVCTEKYNYGNLFFKDSIQRIYRINKKKKAELKEYKEFYKGLLIKDIIPDKRK